MQDKRPYQKPTLTLAVSNEKPASMTMPLSTISEAPHSPEDLEVIRRRLKDILEMVLAALAAQPMPMTQRAMLGATGPMLLLILDKVEVVKLTRWLTSLEEMSRAVNNLGYSQEEYETVLEPLIQAMVAA